MLMQDMEDLDRLSRDDDEGGRDFYEDEEEDYYEDEDRLDVDPPDPMFSTIRSDTGGQFGFAGLGQPELYEENNVPKSPGSVRSGRKGVKTAISRDEFDDYEYIIPKSIGGALRIIIMKSDDGGDTADDGSMSGGGSGGGSGSGIAIDGMSMELELDSVSGVESGELGTDNGKEKSVLNYDTTVVHRYISVVRSADKMNGNGNGAGGGLGGGIGVGVGGDKSNKITSGGYELPKARVESIGQAGDGSAPPQIALTSKIYSEIRKCINTQALIDETADISSTGFVSSNNNDLVSRQHCEISLPRTMALQIYGKNGLNYTFDADDEWEASVVQPDYSYFNYTASNKCHRGQYVTWHALKLSLSYTIHCSFFRSASASSSNGGLASPTSPIGQGQNSLKSNNINWFI